MNANTISYQLLAEIIESGNDEQISKAILDIASKGLFSIELIDRFNLPLLITNYASGNPEAQTLLEGLHHVKAEILQEEKPKNLKDFEFGLVKQFEGLLAPQVTVKFLMLMAQSEDDNYSRLGFKMLVELEFGDEDITSLHQFAVHNRLRFPEAELLVQKIERIEQDYEEVDLEMDADIDDEDENVEEDNFSVYDSDEDDLNDSFISIGSTDSGFDGESDDILIEEEEEVMEEEGKFNTAMTEILMHILKECLSTGHMGTIQTSIDLLEELQLPISTEVYRKHEIARLIVEYAAHNDDAMELLEEIEHL